MIYNLHIVDMEKKFIIPFIKRINEQNLDSKNFFLLTCSSKKDYSEISRTENVTVVPPFLPESKKLLVRIIYSILKFFFTLCYFIFYMTRAKKIYLHGLFDRKVIFFLYIFRLYSKKIVWILWGGGDLELDSKVKLSKLYSNICNRVKSDIGIYLTYVYDDYKFCTENYNTTATWINFLMYESNAIDTDSNALLITPESRNKKEIRIQLGNSADVANNHLFAMDKLKPYTSDISRVDCILSYGLKPWAKDWDKEVYHKGKNIFGDKFVAHFNFMPRDEFDRFQDEIDCAIMAHDRQQAMGNIINLLYLGKTVYLRQDTSHYRFFTNLGIKIKSVENFEPTLLKTSDLLSNREIIASNFSKNRYLQQLHHIFG